MRQLEPPWWRGSSGLPPCRTPAPAGRGRRGAPWPAAGTRYQRTGCSSGPADTNARFAKLHPGGLPVCLVAREHAQDGQAIGALDEADTPVTYPKTMLGRQDVLQPHHIAMPRFSEAVDGIDDSPLKLSIKTAQVTLGGRGPADAKRHAKPWRRRSSSEVIPRPAAASARASVRLPSKSSLSGSSSSGALSRACRTGSSARVRRRRSAVGRSASGRVSRSACSSARDMIAVYRRTRSSSPGEPRVPCCRRCFFPGCPALGSPLPAWAATDLAVGERAQSSRATRSRRQNRPLRPVHRRACA